ncbi:MAG: cyclase/dehydrase [uncultured bacterium]|nr:MAG: cyclase/dehydrase [uncultured bacterium]OGT16798.1 MAG: hypothetical protein A3B69_01040 [Gammaproteobacteria bacterium RIFCSPHIGHO2_02_FULL_38_33]OGT23148.1 MAG: hypothetical protein A2W47_06910 [Gammaproteobacteria bacterium RIFCSPHIGHO2_12_38_15]OGT67438.1 MAG: hypothetical protein A3I12_04065 [Gammaproteobacteria bacterium RIFCSPLOWO2_02_FULL_38_11]OGT78019.1 MAG: hypothetical protein A3G71_03315 [Gammaproteobacteria bacterium RIFCSPLOWO2_12_FULL_38_14]
MPLINRNAIVPYSSMEMFELVNNIEDYPKFLSWCYASRILARNQNEIDAELTLIKNGIKKSFATRNLFQTGKHIEISLLSGPFHHLHGFWNFETLTPQKCEVSLSLEFEFNNKLLSLALNPVFTYIGDTLMEAFKNRAQEIYGKKDPD